MDKLWNFLVTPMSYDVSFKWGDQEPFKNAGTVYTWMVMGAMFIFTGVGAVVLKWGGGTVDGVLKAVGTLVKSVGI